MPFCELPAPREKAVADRLGRFRSTEAQISSCASSAYANFAGSDASVGPGPVENGVVSEIGQLKLLSDRV